VIIHYNTHIKPWNGRTYLQEEYYYYRSRLRWLELPTARQKKVYKCRSN
jgi:lipopolysaccharide biosynthesis glycosyltransferase